MERGWRHPPRCPDLCKHPHSTSAAAFPCRQNTARSMGSARGMPGVSRHEGKQTRGANSSCFLLLQLLGQEAESAPRRHAPDACLGKKTARLGQSTTAACGQGGPMGKNNIINASQGVEESPIAWDEAGRRGSLFSSASCASQGCILVRPIPFAQNLGAN